MCGQHHCDDCCQDNYELGEPIDVQPVPREQRGIVVSVRFNMDEAEALLQRAEFYGTSSARLIKSMVLKEIYTPAVKIAEGTWTS